MERRSFIKHTGLAGILAASSAPVFAQAAPEVKWRLASSFPKSLDTIFGGAVTISERVAKATNNKFQIQTFAGGEIVPAFGVVDAVQNGTVQCAHTAPYYFFGKDPTFAFGCAIPFGMNVRQQNDLPVFGRKPVQRVQHLPVADPFRHRHKAAGNLRHAAASFTEGNYLACVTGAQIVPGLVDKDTVQPGAAVGARLVAVERFPRLRKHILHKVLRLGAVPPQKAHRSAVQLVQMGQRLGLELLPGRSAAKKSGEKHSLLWYSPAKLASPALSPNTFALPRQFAATGDRFQFQFCLNSASILSPCPRSGFRRSGNRSTPDSPRLRFYSVPGPDGAERRTLCFVLLRLDTFPKATTRPHLTLFPP